MAKKVHSVSVKGFLDVGQMEITEITKEAENTYDFLKIIQDFDQKNVSITIKEEQELPTKDMEE
jgi:hypothetical protein